MTEKEKVEEILEKMKRKIGDYAGELLMAGMEEVCISLNYRFTLEERRIIYCKKVFFTTKMKEYLVKKGVDVERVSTWQTLGSRGQRLGWFEFLFFTKAGWDNFFRST